MTKRLDIVEVWPGTDGLWYFHRQAGNGELGNPSEGYSRRDSAWRGAHRWNRDLPESQFVLYLPE